MSEAHRDAVWTLRRRLGRTFAVFGVLLAVLVVLVAFFLREFQSAGDAVIARWQPASMSCQRLIDDMRGQAAALRGYAENGETTFRTSYTTFLHQQRTDANNVHKLAGGDSKVLDQLGLVQDDIDAWHKKVADPVLAAARSHSGGALALLDANASRTSFTTLRDEAQRLMTLLDGRTQSSRDTRARYSTSLVVGLSVAVALLLLAGVLTWRGLHRWVLGPVDRLRAQTRTVAAGATRRQITPDGPHELATLGADVEAMRRQIAEQLSRAEQTQEELQRRGAELSRSNADLQQFAYVASHDLSEPLRKVANFCQLLERQYGPQLDERARQYIEFAVDGARRMQVLIADLLTLSRVGRTTDSFVPVDLTAVVTQAEANLSYRISEAGAAVHYGRLPIIPGDPALLGSLFDNLIGNAIKYRRPDVAPVVEITAEHDSGSASWHFTFSDNGIGIEPQYAERVFAVFQRLHLRDQYGGTGIGLAMCRKIVEFHGGRIWLDTTAPGPGATFRFTLAEGGAHGQAPA